MVKQTSCNSARAQGKEMVVIDYRVFRKRMSWVFLNRAANWLVGSESVQAGAVRPEVCG